MSYGFIDTHAHLDFSQFENDLDNVLNNAKKNKVEKIINIGCNLERSQKTLDLANKFENIWAAVGVHPSDVQDFNDSVLKEIYELAKAQKVVAVGEVGLDYFHPDYDKEKQKEAFIAQIKIAQELNKPLVVHTREAGKDVLEILNKEKHAKVVIHCFSETQEFAEEALKRGYMLSFTGIITYPKADEVRQVVANTPLDRIMIETDCPFLAPQKYRGNRNEPAYVVEVAKKIAEIKEIGLDEVARVTTKNAERFFRI